MGYNIRGHIHGLSRGWLRLYKHAISELEFIKHTRPEGDWGVLNDDDEHSLRYQTAKYRKEREKMSLLGSGCLKSYPAKDEEDAKTWDRHRKKYSRAKALLNEYFKQNY